MNQERFLDRQEALEREGLQRAVRRLEHNLRRSIGMDEVIRRRPLLSLGAGALLGFLVARFVPIPRWNSVRAATRPLARPAFAVLRSVAAAVVAGLATDGRRSVGPSDPGKG